MGNAEKPRIKARAYVLEENEDPDPTNVVESTVHILNTPVKALYDPGAMHSFIASELCALLNFKLD